LYTAEDEFNEVKTFMINGITEMTKYTQKVYVLSLCLSQRDRQCKDVFKTVQELDGGGQSQGSAPPQYSQTQASSIANIFNLYLEKLIHIIS